MCYTNTLIMLDKLLYISLNICIVNKVAISSFTRWCLSLKETKVYHFGVWSHYCF